MYLCLQSKCPLRVNELQQNTSQLHTFPHSPELEITQDLTLVLKIPSKITPKNNLPKQLGSVKGAEHQENCTNIFSSPLSHL